MAIDVKLQNLRPLFETIEDKDQDGNLSASEKGGDVLSTFDNGMIVCHEIHNGDLESWDTLDTWLENTTHRKIEFVRNASGDVTFMAYSKIGDKALDGVITWGLGYDYNQTVMDSLFTMPDQSRLWQESRLAQESCETMRRKKRESCSAKFEGAYDALLKSAGVYNVEIDKFHDAYQAANAAFANGELSNDGINAYIDQYQQTQKAEITFNQVRSKIKVHI